MSDQQSAWAYCPVCGQKTGTMIYSDTVARRWHLYCRKCRQESIVDIENLKLSLSIEPDALTQSR